LAEIAHVNKNPERQSRCIDNFVRSLSIGYFYSESKFEKTSDADPGNEAAQALKFQTDYVMTFTVV